MHHDVRQPVSYTENEVDTGKGNDAGLLAAYGFPGRIFSFKKPSDHSKEKRWHVLQGHELQRAHPDRRKNTGQGCGSPSGLKYM